jgi:6-pyruvoyltetrahydropterin/6-carboxytetrahydropterin synthase
MYEVTIDTDFSAAHNLREYRGKCEALHGHNWKVEITIAADRLDALGMVIDFVEIKRHARDLMERLDHKYLNGVPPFDTLNPSSENLARFIHEEMDRRLPEKGPRVRRVRVWESATSSATYST